MVARGISGALNTGTKTNPPRRLLTKPTGVDGEEKSSYRLPVSAAMTTTAMESAAAMEPAATVEAATAGMESTTTVEAATAAVEATTIISMAAVVAATPTAPAATEVKATVRISIWVPVSVRIIVGTVVVGVGVSIRVSRIISWSDSHAYSKSDRGIRFVRGSKSQHSRQRQHRQTKFPEPHLFQHLVSSRAALSRPSTPLDEATGLLVPIRNFILHFRLSFAYDDLLAVDSP